MLVQIAIFANVLTQIKTNMSNFNLLEGVGHGRETQLQVDEI